MGSPGFIQVPVDGAGKKVATTEVTRADGSIIERQQITIGEGKEDQVLAVLNEILKEIREIKLFIKSIV